MYRKNQTPLKLLLAEDDDAAAGAITDYLCDKGFQVYRCTGQSRAVKLMGRHCFDIALLDISLAEGNGYALCRLIKRQSGTPVIFISARGDERSVVTGLDIGGDDYITKPFRPRELLSRIHSVLRRRGNSHSVIRCGSLEVDTVRGMVTRKDKEIFLSSLEYRILLIFLNNQGKVLSRRQLLEKIWDIGGDYVSDNTLTVYIKRIREKIEEDPHNPRIIQTVRGVGYKTGDLSDI